MPTDQQLYALGYVAGGWAAKASLSGGLKIIAHTLSSFAVELAEAPTVEGVQVGTLKQLACHLCRRVESHARDGDSCPFGLSARPDICDHWQGIRRS